MSATTRATTRAAASASRQLEDWPDAQAPLLAVYTTVGSLDDARRIARAIVERRLAACVQMTRIDSVYRWNGALHEDAEVRMMIKTTAARVDALQAAIRELHPYELPALHAVAVERADAAYADWVRANCSGIQDPR